MRALLLAVALLASFPAAAQLETWETLPDPSMPADCYSATLRADPAGTAVLLGTSCGVYRLSGTSWERLGDDTGVATAMDAAPDGSVFVLRSNAVRRYAPATGTWTVIHELDGYVTGRDVRVDATGRIYVVQSHNVGMFAAGLKMSSDGGQAWQTFSPASGVEPVSVFPAGPYVLLFAYERCIDFCPAFVYAAPSGGSFAGIDLWGEDEWPSLFDAATSRDGTLVVGGAGWIRRSTDGGQTWTDASGVLPNHWVQHVEATDAGLVAYSEDAGNPSDVSLLVSNDAGQTFAPRSTSLDGKRIFALQMGTDGRLYARTWTPATGYRLERTTMPVDTEAPPTAEVLRVAPNPVADVLHIRGTREPVTVVNALGQVVRSMPAGTTSVDVSGLAPGVYIVRAGDASTRVVVGR